MHYVDAQHLYGRLYQACLLPSVTFPGQRQDPPLRLVRGSVEHKNVLTSGKYDYALAYVQSSEFFFWQMLYWPMYEKPPNIFYSVNLTYQFARVSAQQFSTMLNKTLISLAFQKIQLPKEARLFRCYVVAHAKGGAGCR